MSQDRRRPADNYWLWKEDRALLDAMSRSVGVSEGIFGTQRGNYYLLVSIAGKIYLSSAMWSAKDRVHVFLISIGREADKLICAFTNQVRIIRS